MGGAVLKSSHTTVKISLDCFNWKTQLLMFIGGKLAGNFIFTAQVIPG